MNTSSKLAAPRPVDSAAVERMYLDDLMMTHDAVEGLNAFTTKRAAQWQHL